MSSNRFTATLLRASAGGFAGIAVSQTIERLELGDQIEGGFEAWQAHFRNLVLELAAAMDDGGHDQFAQRVRWTRDSFLSRGLALDVLRLGLDELRQVLESSLPANASGELPAFFDAARDELENGSPAVEESSFPVQDEIDELIRRYLDALDTGDAAGAVELVLEEVRSKRLSAIAALDLFLTRVLREVGLRWHAAELSVAEEHFATQTTERLLEHILLTIDAADPIDKTVVLTMVAGDAHQVGLRIVASHFEIAGWKTVCLGANTPSSDLVQMAQKLDADVVVVGATLNTQRELVEATVRALKAENSDRRVIIGGPAFEGMPGRATEVGADACATSAAEAVELAARLSS